MLIIKVSITLLIKFYVTMYSTSMHELKIIIAFQFLLSSREVQFFFIKSPSNNYCIFMVTIELHFVIIYRIQKCILKPINKLWFM
jgi:hypothetical protein